MSGENEQLSKGQEGANGNDKGVQSNDQNNNDVTLQGQNVSTSNGSNGTRANGSGDGGSTAQTEAFGSDGSGGKGSLAEGVEGAGGDSVTGAKIAGEN